MKERTPAPPSQVFRPEGPPPDFKPPVTRTSPAKTLAPSDTATTTSSRVTTTATPYIATATTTATGETPSAASAVSAPAPASSVKSTTAKKTPSTFAPPPVLLMSPFGALWTALGDWGGPAARAYVHNETEPEEDASFHFAVSSDGLPELTDTEMEGEIDMDAMVLRTKVMTAFSGKRHEEITAALFARYVSARAPSIRSRANASMEAGGGWEGRGPRLMFRALGRRLDALEPHLRMPAPARTILRPLLDRLSVPRDLPPMPAESWDGAALVLLRSLLPRVYSEQVVERTTPEEEAEQKTAVKRQLLDSDQSICEQMARLGFDREATDTLTEAFAGPRRS